jgi:hypothetical protein
LTWVLGERNYNRIRGPDRGRDKIPGRRFTLPRLWPGDLGDIWPNYEWNTDPEVIFHLNLPFKALTLLGKTVLHNS